MTTTLNSTNLGARLAAIIDLKQRANDYDPESNPLSHSTVDDVRYGAGIDKGADMIPALNMAAKWPTEVSLGMEADRAATRDGAKADKSAKRMARARKMAEKKAEFDRIVNLDVRPDPERMTMAWRVVFPLVPTVTRIANGKQRWASRYLGSVVDDVAQVVLERMAIVIAKQDKYDLRFLIERADELGEQEGGKPRKPRVAESDEDRKAIKREARARGWLMSMVNNRVMGTLADLYTESRNLRWDNIDILTTVMVSISGVGGDPLVNRHQADRAPAFLGTKFQRPDGIDPAVLATAINAAITERGLDLLVEILLNDDNREHGGAFRWTKNAERVFLATPGGTGEWLWQQVCKATEHHARPKRARADAARMHVRNLFEWLPGFIVQVVESLDPHVIGWAPQPETRVSKAVGDTVTKVTDVRLITGSSVVAAPKAAFDGQVDIEGVAWPLTSGRPVGDAVASEFNEVEVMQVPWRFRQNETRPTWRAEAVLASDFELFYLGDQDEVRTPLVPRLKYATVEDAVAAITEAVQVLTGADLVNSIANA